MRSTGRSLQHRTQAGDLQFALRQGTNAVVKAQREALRTAVAETNKFSSALGREIRQFQARRISALRRTAANASRGMTTSWAAVVRRMDRQTLPSLERFNLAGVMRQGMALAGQGVDAVARQIDVRFGAPQRPVKKSTRRPVGASGATPRTAAKGAGKTATVPAPRRRAAS